MRDHHRPKDVDGIFSEIEGISSRSAIIVASSYLECSLEDVIATRLREPATAKPGFAVIGHMRAGLAPVRY